MDYLNRATKTECRRGNRWKATLLVAMVSALCMMVHFRANLASFTPAAASMCSTYNWYFIWFRIYYCGSQALCLAGENNNWGDTCKNSFKSASEVRYLMPFVEAEQREQTLTQISGPTRTGVFYNLYVKKESDIPRVRELMRQQLDLLRPHHGPVYVQALGTPMSFAFHGLGKFSNRSVVLKSSQKGQEQRISTNDTVLLGRHAEGGEETTLKSLWLHCKQHPLENVVYLHSKGSLHANQENEFLRSFLTRGALSDECYSMPSSCNVCSSRMSPIPHPHTSGNMWLARCEYVGKLMDPDLFSDRMLEYAPGAGDCQGVGRYAAEHWVHSHPSNAPCDLYGDPQFTWGYEPLPPIGDFEMELQPAPRYPMEVYIKDSLTCGNSGQTMIERLAEYSAIYHEAPSKFWWGWNFFGTQCFCPKG